MPKSAAQIRRMQKRAAARGENYEAPPSQEESKDSLQNDQQDLQIKKAKIAKKLIDSLADIESNTDLKAKERRSAKRKAEAIASEEAGGCDAASLIEWYEKEGSSIAIVEERSKDDSSSSTEPASKKQKKSTPYILFIGQLDYQTTSDGLFKHIQEHIGKDERTGKQLITPDVLKVRLLTDSKKKNRSKGMAFVETSNPEISYQLLKLHHTHLDGRRINVERSAGGSKNSEARKEKISSYRKEQDDYMKETVDRILADHRSKGDLEEDELDDGVISLMQRHSAATVEISLAEYIEERGKEMDNPSAYLTSIIGRVAIEGADGANKPGKKKEMYGKKKRSKQGDRGGSQKKRQMGDGGMGRIGDTKQSPLSKASTFAKAGVDMSSSEKGSGEGSNSMLSIFPSMGRGRGRGAYMGRR